MLAAVLGDHDRLGAGLSEREPFRQPLGEGRAVIFPEEFERMARGDLLARIAGDLLRFAVPAHQPLLAVDDVEEAGQRLDDRVGQRLLAPQTGFDARALGDFALQRGVRFAQRRGALLHGPLELVARALQRGLTAIAVGQADDHHQMGRELGVGDQQLGRGGTEMIADDVETDARRRVQADEREARVRRRRQRKLDELAVHAIERFAQSAEVGAPQRFEHGGEEGGVDVGQLLARDPGRELLRQRRHQAARPFGGDGRARPPQPFGQTGQRGALVGIECRLGELEAAIHGHGARRVLQRGSVAMSRQKRSTTRTTERKLSRSTGFVM